MLSAGHDVNLTAAKLDAGNGLAVVAGNDLNSSTLNTVDSSTNLQTRKHFNDTAPRSVRQQPAEPKLSSSMLRP
ncbi:hypothetical protein NB688_000396 [Xanthomonas sacchari]|uniref:Hemagglutinin n=1 Tax=Xanthomonas sacchari TaxID=56458 RepID=A0ABT3DX07_9XANT|nr:hypothetical protein [Xanthomonas sacchari]MCW0399891.1 hypothetical protein [Xanthomonas sacchari]MCW0418230.1 hypothetical protein [Xanthomonas sacchari]UYK72702.1 hypothetical protein NG828_21375 [Xanthomonas sacchari]